MHKLRAYVPLPIFHSIPMRNARLSWERRQYRQCQPYVVELGHCRIPTVNAQHPVTFLQRQAQLLSVHPTGSRFPFCQDHCSICKREQQSFGSLRGFPNVSVPIGVDESSIRAD